MVAHPVKRLSIAICYAGAMEKEDPITLIHRQALIVRVWSDGHSVVWGQIVDPVAEWRATFASFDDLWRVLIARLLLPQSSDETHVLPER